MSFTLVDSIRQDTLNATRSIRLQLPHGHVITKENNDALQCALMVSIFGLKDIKHDNLGKY